MLHCTYGDASIMRLAGIARLVIDEDGHGRPTRCAAEIVREQKPRHRSLRTIAAAQLSRRVNIDPLAGRAEVVPVGDPASDVEESLG